MPRKKSKPQVVLWGGRFQENMDAAFFEFSSSLLDDRRLFPYELQINRAYATVLKAIGVLSDHEYRKISQALDQLQKSEPPEKGFEDIHSFIEHRLAELCGEVAQKLHLGRSRNDLVLTSMRMYFKSELQTLQADIKELQAALYEKARSGAQVLLPAFTHRQPAQPTTLAHFFLAYFFGFERDKKRINSCLDALDVLPLGSCSAVGTNLPLPQEALARELGFSKIAENSLDMVGDRDFLLDVLHALNLLHLRLARLAEDLQFLAHPYAGGFVLPEGFCTGSSAMPHKKNPDALELIRARAARILAAYLQLTQVLKGLGSSYHRDLQEDKKYTFLALDTVRESTKVFMRLLQQVAVQPERLKLLLDETMLALDMAEHMAMQGEPFRQSHRKVGEWVKQAEKEKRSFLEVAKDHGFSEKLNYKLSVDLKATLGSPGRKAIKHQLKLARKVLKR